MYRVVYKQCISDAWQYKECITYFEAKRLKSNLRARFYAAVIQFLHSNGTWIDL